MPSSPEPRRLRRIRASALWAACGDALGFITELADSRTMASRGVTGPLSTPVAWRRRVGGRFGPTVELPAGAISDDTQLRLATCRSIRGDGVFDPETFAKIELTVWPSYALGAGRGSREAAANLKRRAVSWSTNFFASKRSVYVDGGGNGAAMRIQPHVWAAGKKDDWRTDVIVNAVSTHGHMRGVLGALFHATCLDRSLKSGEPPGPEEWWEIASSLREAAALIESHDLLASLWLGLWEEQSSISLEQAVEGVVAEVFDELEALQRIGAGAGGFEDAVEALEAYRPEQRGSGTKTAVLGAVAAWLFKGEPGEAIAACSNRLGIDTDSVATMAGAIVGATVDEEPEMPLLDRPYVASEAERLWAIGEGRQVPSFPYPSIMTWSPPHSQIDCLGQAEGGLGLAGLGLVRISEVLSAGSGKSDDEWVWADLWFGQRLLVKRRAHPKPLSESQLVNPDNRYATASLLDAPVRLPRQPTQAQGRSSSQPLGTARTVHQITDEVIGTGFDPEAVGHALIELAERDDGIEAANQYASIVAKAILSRRDRQRPK
ncbi:MAG TPA: ADP-ribosylglycohydrolase family protein [Solirubrobacterales bacterium]|jgi:ADP-ribosylglycohydrolase|nr:ADP-ribosylglycohydrolase family protein [Solirubrobacterales bacterium]